MAKLELPVQAYIEDFCRQAFPNRDWRRGSATRDLIIAPMAALLQPLRQEIDAVKIGQSIMNYRYMARDDMDKLVANWGRLRQSGGYAYGSVRMYFSRAADYSFYFVEFSTSDGVVFNLVSPITITARDLLANRTANNEFYYDVPVKSVGLGNRYAVSAGSITNVRNAPDSVTRVENIEDFAVTAADETNYDIVNSMWRSLGLRNLVSPASIRAPLFEHFPGLIDIYVAGPDHDTMVRDIVEATVGTTTLNVSVGGAHDIWVNTRSVSSRTVDLAYLPTSKQFKIVSAEQAAESELLYNMSLYLLDEEGRFSDSVYYDTDLDESSRIDLEYTGRTLSLDITELEYQEQFRAFESSIVGGTTLLPMPTPNNDVTGVDSTTLRLYGGIEVQFGSTEIQNGDVIRLSQDAFHKVARKDGNVIELMPEFNLVNQLSYSSGVSAGDLFIPWVGADSTVRVNDRAVVPYGPACGHYRVLKVDATGVWVGNVLSEVELNYSSDVPGVSVTYSVSSGHLPIELDTTCFVDFDSTNGGYDPSALIRVISAVYTIATTELTTETGGPTSGTNISSTIVQGLRGDVAPGEEMVVNIERPVYAAFGQVDRQGFSLNPVLFHSQLDETMASGSDTLEARGIGETCDVGDVILFNSVVATDSELLLSQGDGTRFSVYVDRVLGPDSVQFTPELNFDLPEGLEYSVMRNGDSDAAVSSLSGITRSTVLPDYMFDVTAWPLGLGDGVGLGAKALRSEFTDAGGTVTNGAYTPTTPPAELASMRAGDKVNLTGASGFSDGVYDVLYANDTTVWLDMSDTGTCTGADYWQWHMFTIIESSADMARTLSFTPPQTAIELTFQASGYITISSNEVGFPVRQTVGGTTYSGVLYSYDNPNRKWVVVPNDPAVDTFDTTSDPVEVINGSGTGICTSISAPFTVGYYEPDPTDVSKTVIQGNYVGTLSGYTGAPDYTWSVVPSSEADLFDSMTQLTFVDRNGTGVPLVDDAQGYLRTPASPVVAHSGPATLYVDKDMGSDLGGSYDDITIHSRFGIRGGMIYDGSLQVFPSASVNPDPFDSVIPDTDETQVLFGDFADAYSLQSTDEYALGLVGAGSSSEVIALPRTQGRIRLYFASTVPAGSTTLTVTDSNLGVWAQAGRVLLLTVNGVEYRLPITGPATEDGVTLGAGTQIPIYPSSTVYAEIVEGYHLPYLVYPTAQYLDYRVYRPQNPGTILYTGVSGSYSTGGSAITDANANFRDLLLHLENFDHGDIYVEILDGPDASITQLKVTGFPSNVEATVDYTFTGDGSNVTYYIVKKNSTVSHERLINATITGRDTLVLEEDWPLDAPSHRPMQVRVLAAPNVANGLNKDYDIPVMTASDWDSPTMTLTLDVAEDHVHATDITDVFDTVTATVPDRGFADAVFNKKVRLALQATDAQVARSLSGQMIQTYNYYLDGYFDLPVVDIDRIDLLDPSGQSAVRELDYTLIVDEPGLRYSAEEQNTISIDEDDDVIQQPIRISYVTDSSIGSIHEFVTDDDNRVVAANPLVKRMETISISIETTVRTSFSSTEVVNRIAAWINNHRSNEKLSKDRLIKYLYENSIVSSIDVGNLTLSAVYYKYDGTSTTYSDVDDVFGSETACYLANIITVNVQS